MKKLFLIFTIVAIPFNYCNAQEWFTSFDVAKRLALAQDKMLFVMWENTLDYSYPILLKDDRGNLKVVDLNDEESANKLIWDHFIPVIIFESMYDELYNEAKETRGEFYLDKLDDDSIKIMDVNRNILNTKASFEVNQNLSKLIEKYALNTSFLKQELINYSKDKNLTTSFILASKYLDFAILAEKDIRAEIIQLANIYFDESKKHLPKSDLNNKMVFLQNCDLFLVKEYLILNKPRKAIRYLKKINKTEIYKRNQSLFSFINYTAYKLIKDEENAILWKSKISLVDLRKAKLIINNNF